MLGRVPPINSFILKFWTISIVETHLPTLRGVGWGDVSILFKCWGFSWFDTTSWEPAACFLAWIKGPYGGLLPPGEGDVSVVFELWGFLCWIEVCQQQSGENIENDFLDFLGINIGTIWVCLKIVYPYTQWLMIIIPIKWL